MNVSAHRSTVIVVDVVVGPSALHSSHLHCVQGTKVVLSSDISVFSHIAFKEEVTLCCKPRKGTNMGEEDLASAAASADLGPPEEAINPKNFKVSPTTSKTESKMASRAPKMPSKNSKLGIDLQAGFSKLRKTS